METEKPAESSTPAAPPLPPMGGAAVAALMPWAVAAETNLTLEGARSKDSDQSGIPRTSYNDIEVVSFLSLSQRKKQIAKVQASRKPEKHRITTPKDNTHIHTPVDLTLNNGKRKQLNGTMKA